MEPLQSVQDLLAITLHLRVPEARARAQRLQGRRLGGTQRIQRRVMQHDERGYPQISRRIAPPFAQIFPQLRIGHGQRDTSRTLFAYNPLSWWRVTGLRPPPARPRFHHFQPIRRPGAHVARAATVPLGLLAEVLAHMVLPALHGLHKALHLVVTLPRSLALYGVGNLPYKVSVQPAIFFLPQQNAIRWQAITPRSPRFLVILFHALWQRQVNHRAHGGLVDPQAEGQRAHQHAHLVTHPFFLIFAARLRLHLAVVADGRYPIFFEDVNRLSHSCDRRRVHNHIA